MLTPKQAAEAANKLKSINEVAAFKNSRLTSYLLYVDIPKKLATTWMGDVLGTIVQAGKPYRSGFRDRRVNIRVRGINGLLYAGTAFLDSGDYARIELMKTDPYSRAQKQMQLCSLKLG